MTKVCCRHEKIAILLQKVFKGKGLSLCRVRLEA